MPGGRGGGFGGGRGMGRSRGVGRGMDMGRGMGGESVGSTVKPSYSDSSGLQQPATESMGREQELALLKEQARRIETQLREINARIQALEEGGSGLALTAEIDEEKCTGCLRCSSTCPAGAISMAEDIAHIDRSRCTGCGLCVPVCPGGAIVLKKA